MVATVSFLLFIKVKCIMVVLKMMKANYGVQQRRTMILTSKGPSAKVEMNCNKLHNFQPAVVYKRRCFQSLLSCFIILSFIEPCRQKTTSGQCCSFPFIYRGRLHNTCIQSGSEPGWCALTSNYDRDYMKDTCV